MPGAEGTWPPVVGFVLDILESERHKCWTWADKAEMQLWGFAYKNNSCSLHGDYCAPEWQGIYLLVINNVLCTWIPGRRKLPLCIAACPDYSPSSTILCDYTVTGHKVEKMNHGVEFCPLFARGSLQRAWKATLWARGREYISMKENKTMAETFVTSASRRVNYLYKI